ncbi:unnamed protein product [Euphydryas editha]|uniref:Claspin n=1 Tax=Euphydryas editha TaxID=104508 RepID=A0AAU9U9E7_EUPED|nr:unnamed protein product [Euphydryas editha]
MTDDPPLGAYAPGDRYLESDMNVDMEKITKSPTPEDDDDDDSFTVTKKRIQAFSDSESDVDKDNEVTERLNISNISDKEETVSPHKSSNPRFRIKNIQNSDSDNEESSEEVDLNEKQKLYESVRNENKRKKLKEKFKSLLTSKSNDSEKMLQVNSCSTDDLEEDTHCNEIKQILRASVNTINSICDPDTSDEDSAKEENKHKKKYKSKTMKSTSPKPLKMSAKQAMENMQKIKSESNRMLREMEVSLPYHRPKALSLKDIMSRRKTAVSSDGKILPIKMNEEQLKQYAMMLEQRQKEVIELCKSDTDDEENEEENQENVENKCTDLINKTESSNNPPSTPNENDINYLNTERDNRNDSIKETDQVDNDTIKEKVNNSLIDEEIPTLRDVDDCIDSELSKQKENESMNITNEKQEVQSVVNFPSGSHSNVDDESQVLALHYDSEKVDSLNEKEILKDTSVDQPDNNEMKENGNENSKNEDSFEDELNYDEIEKFISNAESLPNVNKKIDETSAINSIINVNPSPKLTGCPGSFINLDDSDPSAPRKLSGVEMLKERFTYFAKLNSLEENVKDKDKKYKPGTQHLKLKQELEQQIAEQRSMEWEKRLEAEQQLKSEINGELSDDDIEKIEAKLEDTEIENKAGNETDDETSESEDEPIEDDVILEDKPKKHNPMVDDEAEESECDDVIGEKEENDFNDDLKDGDGDVEDEDADLEDEDEYSDSSSSDSEEEIDSKPKKGRILKAFEDSDDESTVNNQDNTINNEGIDMSFKDITVAMDEKEIKETQDDYLQLAQANKSSDDLFSTQESNTLGTLNKNNEDNVCGDMGTQSFSIMDSVGTNFKKFDFNSPDKLSVDFETQSQKNSNLNQIVGMCSGSLPEPISQSQEIGDDVLALCTGKFYDNPIVSQGDKNNELFESMSYENSQSQEIGDNVVALCTGKFYDNPIVTQNTDDNTLDIEATQNTDDKTLNTETTQNTEVPERDNEKDKAVLKSILDELDEPELDVPKQNKYFFNTQSKDTLNSQLKKKFVIDSDDENDDTVPMKKPKKLKKRKAEQRALQISDDEEEEFEEEDDSKSETEEEEERIVEYDSEENEVEVQVKPKKKRIGEFFENEAELTSEDEWVGSGDEDEKGLDRMEREEGDDDVFHQGQLQSELGQIHMREVLDQDKREVRLLQELLFEDGDLGDGHRQRKFRWKNAGGEIETGTNPDEFLDTQEDEFESEEQWRKQRHEREMFLRKMQEKEQENLDTSINRTTIIKANLNSRSMSTLIAEIAETKSTTTKNNEISAPEKKITKDIPSPKKPFTIFQQNYHGSLLTRGRGALARLAALATPLASDTDDAPKAVGSTNRRNFVFAAVTNDDEPKVTKRKAENVNTPRLMKKMKTEEKSKYIKNSLFDHLTT